MTNHKEAMIRKYGLLPCLDDPLAHKALSTGPTCIESGLLRDEWCENCVKFNRRDNPEVLEGEDEEEEEEY